MVKSLEYPDVGRYDAHLEVAVADQDVEGGERGHLRGMSRRSTRTGSQGRSETGCRERPPPGWRWPGRGDQWRQGRDPRPGVLVHLGPDRQKPWSRPTSGA